MSFTAVSRRLSAVAAVAAACLCATAPALAAPMDAHIAAAAYGGDHAGVVRTVAVAPADPEVMNGDRPSDRPGVNGNPRIAPSVPIEIVRPERTIVRDGVSALPIVLAGLALLVALAGCAELVAQRRTLQARPH